MSYCGTVSCDLYANVLCAVEDFCQRNVKLKTFLEVAGNISWRNSSDLGWTLILSWKSTGKKANLNLGFHRVKIKNDFNQLTRKPFKKATSRLGGPSLGMISAFPHLKQATSYEVHNTNLKAHFPVSSIGYPSNWIQMWSHPMSETWKRN